MTNAKKGYVKEPGILGIFAPRIRYNFNNLSNQKVSLPLSQILNLSSPLHWKNVNLKNQNPKRTSAFSVNQLGPVITN